MFWALRINHSPESTRVLVMVNYPCCADSDEVDNGGLGFGLYDIHPGNYREDTISWLFAFDFAKTNIPSLRFPGSRFRGWPRSC